MTDPIFEPDASPLALAFVFATAALVLVAIVAAGIWLGVARG